QPQQRILGVRGLVVDRHLGGLDRPMNDGQEGRLLPRQADRLLQLILEVFAQLGRYRGAGDALAEIEILRHFRCRKTIQSFDKKLIVRTRNTRLLRPCTSSETASTASAARSTGSGRGSKLRRPSGGSTGH